MVAIDMKDSCPIHELESGREPSGAPQSDSLFDSWLAHHLGRLYGKLVDEPLPGEVIRMLEQKLR